MIMFMVLCYNAEAQRVRLGMPYSLLVWYEHTDVDMVGWERLPWCICQVYGEGLHVLCLSGMAFTVACCVG